MNGPYRFKDGELCGSLSTEMPEEYRAEMKKTKLAHGLLAATEPPGIGQLKNFSSLR